MQVPPEYCLKKISLNEQSIAYIDTEKHGETILFIHGMGSSSAIWLGLIQQLSSTYRCIAIDLPGHGDSSATQQGFTLTAASESIFNLIKALNLEYSAVTICGHSMGGQVALLMAIRYPTIFEKLILISSAGLEKFNDREIRLIMMGTVMFPTELMKACTIAMLNEPVYDYLQTIKQQTLIVFGTNDPMIPNPLARNLTTTQLAENALDLIPNAQLKLLNYKGHFLPLEAVNELKEVILAFLEL